MDMLKSGCVENLATMLTAPEPDVIRAALKALVPLMDEYGAREAFALVSGQLLC